MSPQAKEIKAKINYWDYIKIKTFCAAKETINKTERQLTEWEKIFANDISDKGLVSEVYKALIQLNTQNGQIHEQTFLQRRHPDGQQTHPQHHSSSGKCKSKLP